MTAILDRLGIEQPQHYLPVAIGDAPAALTTSSHRKPEVLFVGRLSAVRGCEQLVRAIPAILRAVPDARVIVVGDGAERPRLEAMTDDLGVREHVTFVGAVAPADVSFYYRRARVAVNPVRVPETGNATIEALAHGVPVVRSIVPGFDGFPVVDGFNGRHYPLDDIGALSSRIVDVITSSAWQEMSDSARTTARSFSIEESVSQLERILWSVIESRLQVDA
jgi:glycosyltransferase involved in cell wall biosynthesis